MNFIYTFKLPETVSGGTWTITVGDEATNDIAHNADKAGVRSAVEALNGVDSVTVEGEAGGPYTITFTKDPVKVTTSGKDLIVQAGKSKRVISRRTVGKKTKTPTAKESYDVLRQVQGSLIRKVLGGFILAGDMEVDVPDRFFQDKNGTFVNLKELGYECVGHLAKGDGIVFTRETEQSEVESFGESDPTRIDITKDATSAAFKCQETNRLVLEMFYNKDLSDVVVDPETGEISFENERQPGTKYRRLIYIGKDGNGDEAKFLIKVMPRATVSEVQEESWSNESELAYGLTVKATADEDLGYSIRNVFGGPGFQKLYEKMGFVEA